MVLQTTYCQCEKCKQCCRQLPGFFKNPQEVKIAAQYCGLGLRDFLDRFCIASWRDGIVLNGKECNVQLISPARKGHEGRREDFGYPLIGWPCTFFKNGKCTINDVKPYECKMSFGCRDDGISYRDKCLIEWDKLTKQNKIPQEILQFWDEAVQKRLTADEMIKIEKELRKNANL